jgi:outer membrane protein OmpA-like peptidoglycan-associated protein
LRVAGFLFLFVFFCFSQDKTHTIYFDTDLSKVTNIEKNRLLSFIATLSEKNVSSVEIFGFCDDVGASSYNMSLSQERAEKIKKILLNNLIEERLITNVDGKGELLFRTTASTSPDRIRALNRKVELSVSFSQEVTLEKKTILTKGSSLVIENLLFMTGYSYLTPSSKKSLDLAFERIKDLPFSFTIQGHVCCTSGQKDAIDRATRKRNLSFVRAKFVYDYFVEKGIDSKRMTFEGLGHQFPLGGSPEQDRRVEILIESDF